MTVNEKISIGKSNMTLPKIAGLVAVTVAGVTWGTPGKFLIFVIILLAVTSTAAAEIIAVSSISIYDIFMIYLKVSLANLCKLYLKIFFVRSHFVFKRIQMFAYYV